MKNAPDRATTERPYLISLREFGVELCKDDPIAQIAVAGIR
jgi:hypothetical protein